jgi:glycosyltransferase involved in cell wall biosynthesis
MEGLLPKESETQMEDMNNKVSVIMPSRNEEYLNNTLKDILKKAKGDFEIVVVLDGPTWEPPIKDRRIRYIKNKKPKGMRNAINTAANNAAGKYLLKCDAHCCFDKGFDIKLKNDCEPDWTVVPRRYAIDKRKWERHPDRRWCYDFQYIGHPKDPEYSFKGVDWPEYGSRVKGQQIVDLMTSQGSCWFMYRDRFFELGGLDEENYGSMGAEAQEVCLKSWLSGGRYVLNRKTWYAHKKKRTSVKHRGYRKPVGQWRKSRAYLKECWLNNKWPGQVRDLKWLIQKFKPVPGWHTNMASVKSNRLIRERFKLNVANNKYPRLATGLNRDGLVKLWRDLDYKVGAEIGVAKGFFSNLMFKGIPGLKMYLVDPYTFYKDVSRYVRPFPEMEIMARKAMEGYNATWIKELSETAYKQIKDKSLDFVYIDGNHRYNYVMLDIILWIRKVRPGGMISGHDYNTAGRKSKREIRLAVEDYTRQHKISPWYITDIKARRYKSDRHASWFWIK